ncbi:sperm-associated antigen 5 isoform X2 [Mixophyes fleayi]|uniref:sperm-associated antigen 5 isoform X2 n=1 Tax=Mixophyes fleayi TaxID=3061075 RepID=UPI003F4E42DB
MWSPNSPVCDENQIPAAQNVHRKSVGRTPLKVLTGQHLAVPDPNISINKRSSLTKPHSHTVLMTKETSSGTTGKPVNVWIDPCHKNILADSSDTKDYSSKDLQPCPLLTTTVSEVKRKETLGCLKNNDQCSKPGGEVLPSHPVSSDEKQSNEHENIHNLEVEYSKLPSLPPDIAANKLAKKQRTVLEDTCQKETDISYISSRTNFEVCSNTTARSPLKLCTDRETTSLNDEDIHLSVDDNGTENISNSVLDFNKAKMYIPLPEKDLLHCKPLTEACQVLCEVELNAVCANDTYDLDPHFNDVSEQSLVTTLPDMLSDVTLKIEKCSISVEQDEECYQLVLAKDDCTVGSGLQIEKLSSSLSDSLIDDLKTAQLIDASEVIIDKPHSNIGYVVTDEEAECFLPELSNLCLPVEDLDLLTEVLSLDHEIPSCSIKQCTENNDLNILEDVNQYFASIEDTPACILTASAERVESQPTRLTPISNMHQTCQSNSASGPQKSMKDVSSIVFDCPTPVMSTQSRVHEIPLLSRNVFKKVTPKILNSPYESGTCMTPIFTSDAVTWTTPIMLLNKSINTSLDIVGKAERSAKDNASETDSLLWNFSRETLSNASREDLIDRLEGSLIVIEVLSRQLQGWQQDNVSSKPSEQRECSTQTCVTHCSEEEPYYHNLYLKTLNKLQSVQHCREEEKQLHDILKEVTERLTSHNSEAEFMIEYAENLYKITQKDKVDLCQNLRCTRAPLADHMAFMAKTKEKMQDCLLQRNKMKARMEDAILAKEALSYNEELVDFVQRARSVCYEMEDDRAQLMRQCSEAKELMSQHWCLFEVMKKKTQSALGEYEEIKNERDMAILENKEMCDHFINEKSQNERMKLENSRLGSELESLMERLCKLESENEQSTEENAELEEQLSAKDSSMKLLEKELNEATVRGQEYRDQIKYLSAEIVPRLELELSESLNQKQALQTQLRVLKKEHASQIAYYTESLEFLEQENGVCREQVSETESQLKTHHLTLLERNFQCESLKDSIKELQSKVNELQEQLSNTKDEAQNQFLKMGKEISDSSMEVSKIRSRLLALIENLRESTNGETKGSSSAPHTPGGSLVLSNNIQEEHMNTTNLNVTDSEDQRVKGIWSKTSAFTVVLPVSSPSAGTPQENLTDALLDLSNIVADVVTTSSYAIESKQEIIQDFKKEISSQKKEFQSQRFQHTSDICDLQVELDKLRRRHCILDAKVNDKEKCISQLQEVINQQEQKILQQFNKEKESEALIEVNEKLRLSLKLCENEAAVLKAELAQNPAEAARNWIQEKLLLHKDLATLRLKLVDMEYTKSETVQRLMRHKDILAANLYHSEAEVRKLDAIIEKVRGALLSVSDVNCCDTLKQLMEFLN